jgi:hypothetical protein
MSTAADNQSRLKATDRLTFVVTLRAELGVSPIRALRAALKVLLRGFGLRAISIRERP